MNRPTRAFSALGLLLGLICLPTASSSAADGSAPSVGFSQVAGCISGAQNLLVSVVVDESLSLRQTDPRALRVQGITTAIDSLQQLTTTTDKSLNVEMSMSTFARSYRTLADWRKLSPQNAESLRATARRVLPDRDAGNATDYRQALLGAKRQLDTRQKQLGDPNACKVLLWFTDGALDVDAQTGTATQQLCQVGGIADAVRDDGIAVVALALFTPGAGVTQSQRDRLQAVAQGRTNGVTCGSVPIPSDSATGVYLPANDPAALQRLFAGAGALVAGGTEVGSARCPGPSCRHGDFPLQIDPGVAGARVLVQAASDPRVTVTSPRGHRVQLKSGQERRVDGAVLSYLARDRLATVNISFSPYTKARSRWLVSPAVPSSLSVYWFWGAKLASRTTDVKAGSPARLEFQLQDQNGDPLPPRLYRDAKATITVGDRHVPARIDRAGLVSGRVDLGTDALPSHVPVSASVSASTIPRGVRLGPVSVSSKLPVTLPPVYPQVTPSELDFGHVEGLATARAQLHLTGSRLGPTDVCVTSSTVTFPGQAAREGAISAPSDCVKLQPDQTKSLTLKLTPTQTADGVANGEVTLRMTAADGSKDISVRVPTVLDMQRKVDESTRWALVAALLGLAILLPLLMLVGSNLLLARFVMTSTSRTAAKPVTITPSGLRSLDGGALLEPEDFENATFSGVRKGGRMTIVSGITLSARRIFSLKAPEGVATGPTGQLLVSSVMPYRGGALNEAPVRLADVDATFVVVSPTGATPTEATGTLVMVVPGDVDRQGIKDRAARMSSVPQWDKALSELEQPSGGGQAPRVRASSREKSSEPSMARSGASPSTASTDSPPGLPWDWASGDTSTAPPSEASKNTRPGKSRKPRRDPSNSPPPSPGVDEGDDGLPPLPDFLK